MKNKNLNEPRELRALLLEAAEMIHALRWMPEDGKAPPPPDADHAAEQLIAELLEYRRRLNLCRLEPTNALH